MAKIVGQIIVSRIDRVRVASGGSRARRATIGAGSDNEVHLIGRGEIENANKARWHSAECDAVVDECAGVVDEAIRAGTKSSHGQNVKRAVQNEIPIHIDEIIDAAADDAGSAQLKIRTSGGTVSEVADDVRRTHTASCRERATRHIHRADQRTGSAGAGHAESADFEQSAIHVPRTRIEDRRWPRHHADRAAIDVGRAQCDNVRSNELETAKIHGQQRASDREVRQLHRVDVIFGDRRADGQHLWGSVEIIIGVIDKIIWSCGIELHGGHTVTRAAVAQIHRKCSAAKKLSIVQNSGRPRRKPVAAKIPRRRSRCPNQRHCPANAGKRDNHRHDEK